MLDKVSQQKLDRYLEKRKKNVCRSIYILHLFINEWAQKQWKADGWEDIRPEHLRLIAIIGKDTVNNNKLAHQARVSKQAMSKMVTDLEARGFITVQPDPNDSRAKLISISPNGVDFLEYWQSCTKPIEKQFTDLIGKEKTDQLRELLAELTENIIRENEHLLHVKKQTMKYFPSNPK